MSGNIEEQLKILIVDDIETDAEALKLALTETLETVDVTTETDFDKAMSILLRPHPYDAIVLDIIRGNTTEDRFGQSLWQEILNKKFIPVVVYTAGECDMDPPFPEDNPILKCFQKRAGNDVVIASHLKSVRPYILELREIQKEFSSVIKDVLLKTSPVIWKAETDNDRRPQLFLRSARRRLAAMMDLDTLMTGERMLFWEQYVLPPLGDNLLMGDLLRDKGGDPMEPSSYRLVLTPSCDLDTSGGRKGIDNVLVAKCRSPITYFQAVTGAAIGNTLSKKARDKLSTSLTQPQCGGYVFLPEFKSVLPPMSACLRDLELIPSSNIGTNEKPDSTFARVVSIDSPFREYLAWAYLQVAGRPGIPDRDLERCIEDNFGASKPSTQS